MGQNTCDKHSVSHLPPWRTVPKRIRVLRRLLFAYSTKLRLWFYWMGDISFKRCVTITKREMSPEFRLFCRCDVSWDIKADLLQKPKYSCPLTLHIWLPTLTTQFFWWCSREARDEQQCCSQAWCHLPRSRDGVYYRRHGFARLLYRQQFSDRPPLYLNCKFSPLRPQYSHY